jgi:uncharacterized protein YueI
MFEAIAEKLRKSSLSKKKKMSKCEILKKRNDFAFNKIESNFTSKIFYIKFSKRLEKYFFLIQNF